jgi:AraC-like DNA-binding protein
VEAQGRSRRLLAMLLARQHRGGDCYQRHDAPLNPGQLYLITPHTRFDGNCVRPFAKWYIHFTISSLNAPCEPGVTIIRPTTRMRTLLTEICPATNSARWQQGAAARPLNTIELIVLVLQRALVEMEVTTPANEQLSKCIAFMRQRFVEKVTLASMARFTGTSQRTLSQIFVAETGFSPIRYLIELRLNHAMQLLRHTNHSIEQIAAECGFANRGTIVRRNECRSTPAHEAWDFPLAESTFLDG